MRGWQGQGGTDPQQNRQLGLAAEEAAARWLLRRGHRVLARNLRRRGVGEIDLLSHRDGTLHLSEVKAGRCSLEELAARIDRAKLRRLLAVCALWLSGEPEIPPWSRIQVDLLLLSRRPGGWRLRRLADCCPPEWLLEDTP
jgi:putative endonuclease